MTDPASLPERIQALVAELQAWLEPTTRNSSGVRLLRESEGLLVEAKEAILAESAVSQPCLDVWISVNQALHAVGSPWRIEQHPSGQAVAVPTPECFSSTEAVSQASGWQPTVHAFVHWVKTTPHSSLSGDSRVAYEAQVRVLDQLLWFLEGKDDYLNSCIAWAQEHIPAPPSRPGTQEPER